MQKIALITLMTLVPLLSKAQTCQNNIKNKTLVIGGKYDSMREADLKKMSELIPQCRFNICENGSHLSMWDDQENYFKFLLAFIRNVEAGKL